MKNTIGLGDIVHWAIRPAIYFIDWLMTSDMKHCDVCKARRARWNAYSAPTWLVILLLTLLGIFTFFTLI